jgi:hypothetical protein
MPPVKVANVMPNLKSTLMDITSEAKQRGLAKDVELGGSQEGDCGSSAFDVDSLS